MTAPAILYYYFPRYMPYSLVYKLQADLVSLRLKHKTSLLTQPLSSKSLQIAQTDIFLLQQHQPVYTLGKRRTEMREDEVERLRKLGADVVKTERGGLITYHGPGQLVGYPILDLNGRGDVTSSLWEGNPYIGANAELPTRTYVELVSQFLYNLLGSLPTPIKTIPPSTESNVGLFVTPTSKIASIGIQLQHRIASHGFSLNVETQVERWFQNVVACGLEGVSATSISSEGGKDVKVEEVVPRAVEQFGETLHRQIRPLMEQGAGEIVEMVRETERCAHPV